MIASRIWRSPASAFRCAAGRGASSPRQARLYVDSRAAALQESGDVIAAPEVFAEIGELLAG